MYVMELILKCANKAGYGQRAYLLQVGHKFIHTNSFTSSTSSNSALAAAPTIRECFMSYEGEMLKLKCLQRRS